MSVGDIRTSGHDHERAGPCSRGAVHENADALEKLLRVIYRTEFWKLLDSWSRFSDCLSLATGVLGRGAAYMSYSPHKQRAINNDDVYYLERASCAILPLTYAFGMDFHGLPTVEQGRDVRAGLGIEMNDEVVGWENKEPFDTVILHGTASASPRSDCSGENVPSSKRVSGTVGGGGSS